jgi:hypothetical protein
MPTQAQVGSVDALDRFRSGLILYVERARHILEDVLQEVTRTRAWLEHDRQPHWQKQIKLRSRALAQAEQELLTARLSEQIEAIRDRRRSVEHARNELADAEAALDRVRRWLRQYDRDIDPHAKAAQSLRLMLDVDLVKAAALLAETIRVLADYAAVAPDRPEGSAPAEAGAVLSADAPLRANHPAPARGGES